MKMVTPIGILEGTPQEFSILLTKPRLTVLDRSHSRIDEETVAEVIMDLLETGPQSMDSLRSQVIKRKPSVTRTSVNSALTRLKDRVELINGQYQIKGLKVS